MLNGRQILVLEDEALLRKSLCAYLDSQGAITYPAVNLAQAREVLKAIELDFALLDINLPDGNGLDLLDSPGFSANTRVVVMTAEGGIRTAIEAIKRGASDYLSKPFDAEELPMVFSRAARDAAENRIKEFEQEKRAQPSDSLFFGQRMKSVQSGIRKILQADQRLDKNLPPILMEGETGTGKSTLARWIHEQGPRAAAPLIEINCSTLPESLAESELFGHERGAFTDARKERIGLFEAADGGTLFLDEIASLSPSIQAKVLNAIEDGHIRRVGSNLNRKVDVRLIAASLHPLEDLVREGTFREDLFHRLNLLHVQIPPLRRFPDDIPALAEYLLQSIGKRYQMPELSISSKGKAQLMQYDWPGNVRELLHELERAVIFTDSGQLSFEKLSGSTETPSEAGDTRALMNPFWELPENGFQFEDALQELTLKVIHDAMAQENDNVSAAARRLGVSRDFIRYRLGH
ncbi:MAG: sigma-54-dependent transcriptional regulator [Puniceicoccaceae bacterium]